MSTRQYTYALSNDSIDFILSHPSVAAAKLRILEKGASSEYFTLPLTTTLRTELFETMGLQLSAVSSIPMRWIVGDTPAHHDHGVADFTNTYLVYLTNSPGIWS